jgi:hypothetical protein
MRKARRQQDFAVSMFVIEGLSNFIDLDQKLLSEQWAIAMLKVLTYFVQNLILHGYWKYGPWPFISGKFILTWSQSLSTNT